MPRVVLQTQESLSRNIAKPGDMITAVDDNGYEFSYLIVGDARESRLFVVNLASCKVKGVMETGATKGTIMSCLVSGSPRCIDLIWTDVEEIETLTIETKRSLSNA